MLGPEEELECSLGSGVVLVNLVVAPSVALSKWTEMYVGKLFGTAGGMYLIVPITPLTKPSLTSTLTVSLFRAFDLL